MPRHRVAKTALCIFFAAQVLIALAAYGTARVQGEAQRLGWQMFTGHSDDPTFVVITPAGERPLSLHKVFRTYRSELNDDIVFDPKVIAFVCAMNADANAVRVTNAADVTRTETCEAR